MFAPSPIPLSSYNSLTPVNHDLKQFLITWLVDPRLQQRPTETGIKCQMGKTVTRVRYQDLYGDRCDLQGIDWTAMGVTRQQARDQRTKTFRNYVSLRGSDKWATTHKNMMPWTCESFFRFRRMHQKQPMHLAHFQLRNLLVCNARSCAYFADHYGTVCKMNTLTGDRSVALKFGEHPDVQISTIAGNKDILVAGGFGGEYCISDLTSEYVGSHSGTVRAEGTVTSHASGISNHIEIHSLRSSSAPLAAFASNDMGLRIVDLNTEKVLSALEFPFAVNCTAISPDRRLRVVVGDSCKAFIIPAEPERAKKSSDRMQKPEYLRILEGHQDFGFACAWAPDGYTLATGNQDRAIKIWDARKWNNTQGESTPVVTLRTQLAGARSLRFSPAGSGKRVLVAAEEADYVDIIDAQTFRTQQTVDIFGEIGGISLTDDGQDLMVLSADYTRGGLMHFERCDTESVLANADDDHDASYPELRRPGSAGLDWAVGGDVVPRWEKYRANRRRLRTAAAGGMAPF